MKRVLHVGPRNVITERSDLTGSDVKSIILDNEGGVFDFPPNGHHEGQYVRAITVMFKKQDDRRSPVLRITEEASSRGNWDVWIAAPYISDEESDRINTIMYGDEALNLPLINREDIYYYYFKKLFPGSVGGRRSRRRRFTRGRRHSKRRTTRSRPNATLGTRFITRS